jgi:simple sugar transport system substrate-binding protein
MISNFVAMRHLLRALSMFATALLLLLSVLPASAQQGELPKVGIYLPFPDGSLRGDLHARALRELASEFSGKAEIFINRGVPSSGIVGRITRLETENYAGMIMSSPAYYNPVAAQVAASPTTMYVSVKADNTNPQKVNTFGIRLYEAFYIAGVMAGKVATESGIAGFIGGTPTVEAARNVNAFALGMRSVRSDAQVKLVFIGKIKDVKKEQTAANWLMNQSAADVLVSDTDSDEVPRLATANRVWTIPVRTPDSLQGKISRYTLFRIVPKWEAAYRRQLTRVLEGQKQYQFSWSGFGQGAFEIKDFNPILPVTHVQEVAKVAEEIGDGSRFAFGGPIRVNGKEIVGPGDRLSDDQLIRMNYFVEGISILKSN